MRPRGRLLCGMVMEGIKQKVELYEILRCAQNDMVAALGMTWVLCSG